MPWLVELLMPVVSAIIAYIAKHREEYLSFLFGKIGNIISKKVGDTAAIVVCTNPNVAVELDIGKKETFKQIADEHGHVKFVKDLKAGDVAKITAYGDGYCMDTTEVSIDSEDVTYCVVLKLKPRKNKGE